MSDALRSILASFVIEVDKAGELAKGNAAVDALKKKLEGVQAAANPAARAVSDVFSRAGGSVNSFLAQQGAKGLGGGGGGSDGFFNAGALKAKQFGPTRHDMDSGRAAAAAYAQTLRGKLASAVEAVRAGFNSPSGGKGPGLIATLGTVRNGMLALGAGAAVAGIKRLVDGIGDISEGAARLGVTTDEFQRMSTWARQNATDVDTLGTAFRTLAISAVDPTKETAAAFADLGVKTTDAAGQFKTSQQLFFEVGEALSGVTNETVRTQLAQKLLGRSAIALKPMFAQGTEAFRKQREEMLKLKVLSPEVIKAADDLSDSWVVLSSQLLAAAGPVLRDTLFPALKKLTAFLVKGVEWLGKLTDKTDFLAVAITALGYAVWTKLVPRLVALVAVGPGASASLFAMAGAAGKAAASFAMLALKLFVIQDLISFLMGNESQIGGIMDRLFGKGASAGVLEALGKAWDLFASAIKRTLELLGLRKMDEEDKAQAAGADSTWEGSNFQRLGERIRGGVPAKLFGGVADDEFMKSLGAGRGGAQPSVVVGDTSIAITMSQSATASDVAREVSSVLDPRDRAATLASY